MADGEGLPLAAVLSGGERHEAAFFEAAMDAVRVPQPIGRPRKRPKAVAGDKAYDATWIRHWCHARDIESVIPTRKNKVGPGRPPTCDEQKYRRRNTIERCVGRLKERRRIATRYEKKASHYRAILQWAFIGDYLRRYFSDTT